MKRMWVIGFVALAAVVGGCAGAGGSSERAERLMVLAQEETRSITVPKDRLTRLLNIAEIQIRFDRAPDARKSLDDAASTLRSTGGSDLDQHTQLAGWISISELSRRADGKASANKATDEGMTLLRRVEPVTDRCQYVRAIAAEVKELRGEPAGAKLLAEGAQWASKITDNAARRQALAAFADDAFRWEQYEAGRDVLRCDADPAWRADTLTRMAEAARPPVGGMFAREERNRMVPAAGYGKSLSYEKNFQQQK